MGTMMWDTGSSDAMRIRILQMQNLTNHHNMHETVAIVWPNKICCYKARKRWLGHRIYGESTGSPDQATSVRGWSQDRWPNNPQHRNTKQTNLNHLILREWYSESLIFVFLVTSDLFPRKKNNKVQKKTSAKHYMRRTEAAWKTKKASVISLRNRATMMT